MADLVIPAGAITVRAGDPVNQKIMQVAGASGQGVYEDLSNGGKLNLADADAEASAKLAGVLISDSAAGEWASYALPGAVITVASGIFTKGVIYVVSTTAGGFAPFADLASGDYVTYGLLALSTTTARVVSIVSGVAL